jgi:broad specificity phosphatase PhoE
VSRVGRDMRAPERVRTTAGRDPRSTRLVLVRHGESACSLAGVVGGLKGCTGLSERGVLEAEALRDRLRSSGELVSAAALYSSVLPRARQTASIAAPGIGGGLDVVSDCSLCELHPGEADGLTWEEFSARYDEPNFDAQPDVVFSPGGESWTGFVSRASGALADIASKHSGQMVVVVCHAGVVEASMTEFLPVCSRRGRLKLRTQHTSITEWELDATGWRLLRYNDSAHLAD